MNYALISFVGLNERRSGAFAVWHGAAADRGAGGLPLPVGTYEVWGSAETSPPPPPPPLLFLLRAPASGFVAAEKTLDPAGWRRS